MKGEKPSCLSLVLIGEEQNQAERNMDQDARFLWYEVKNQDKELQLKRKWLMGLSARATSSRKRLKSNGSMLPETMLREDDAVRRSCSIYLLFYESLKKHVEKSFGVSNEAAELPTTCHVEPLVQHKIVKTVLALLNDFTNNGLNILAKVIGGSSIEYEQTRWKMKKFIAENIPKVLGKECSSCKEVEVYNKLCQILNDPHNFQKNHVTRSSLTANTTIRPTKHSHHDAIEAVLLRLETMSVQTLCAMHRRLKGIKGSLPIIKRIKSCWNRPRLAERVKSLSRKMLSSIDKWDELPVPVMKAMDAACLSLKLSNQNPSISRFCSCSPEIETLENEIVKAIRLLSCKVGVPELKILKELLAPGFEYQVHNGGLRLAIKKMLTEFLFECSDMDKIPTVLLDTLAVINRCALRQEEVAEELESILNVSAQVKQIVWDSLPDYELDLEFSDAYMEDLEESDVGEFFDDEEEELSTNNLDGISEVGSTADSHCVDSSVAYCSTPISNVNIMSIAKSQSVCKTEIKMEPDDLLFTPSVGLSKSFNRCTASLGSTMYHTEQTNHMADTKDSVIRFSLSSNLSDQNPGKKHCQSSSCKVEPVNLGDFESNVPGDTCRNKYIAIQQACDETSLIAYRLVGQILKGYADIEEIDLDERQLSYLNDGNLSAEDCQETIPNEDQTKSTDDVDTSVIIQAVQELIPSFPYSELEKVRKILR
ncbi:hypothetical protein V2J09_014070 [Rumex salicifolius]